MKKTLHIQVRNKIATYKQRGGAVVCANANYQIAFDFDAEWDKYPEKTARFTWNGRHFDQRFTGNTCPMPPVFNTASCLVGVYVDDFETTTPAKIDCLRSVLCDETTPHTESDKNYADEAKISADEARKSADEARKSADNAAKDAVTAAMATAEEEVVRLVGEIGIVQELGTSQTATVSQAKVTKEFEHHQSQITRNTKEIANIKAGMPDEDFLVDATAAAVKDVPDAALPYAEVVEIGGLTRKCTNLWSLGDITANAFPHIRYISLPAGTYTISLLAQSTDTDADTCRILLKDANGEVYFWACERGIITSKTVTLKAPLSSISFDASANSTTSEGDTATFTNIMLNEGSTALPYEPYFEGLRSAPVTEVESVGANLINPSELMKASSPEVKLNGDVFTVNVNSAGIFINGIIFGKAVVLPAGTYTVSVVPLNDIYLAVYAYAKKNNAALFQCGIGKHTNIYEATFTANEPFVLSIGGGWNSAAQSPYFGTFAFKLQLVRDSTSRPYRPYTRHTLPIPEAVRNIDGYGIGLPSVPNSIRWEENGCRTWNKRIEKVVLDGSESVLDFKASAHRVQYNTEIWGKAANNGLAVLCADYITATSNALDSISIYQENYSVRILIFDKNIGDTINTQSEWSAYLAERYAAGNPLTIYYELATLIVEDISDILPADNLIGVEGGGTVTMVNEYGYDVPSTIVYQLDNESEVSA